MPRRRLGQEKIRSIQKSNGTYLVSIPIDLMRTLGWRERQKVVINRYGRNKLIVTDYKG